MSILFDANSEYVQFNDAAIDQLDAMTVVAIYYANSVSGGPYNLLSKDLDGSNDQFGINRPSLSPGPDDWSFFHRRATTNSFVRSTGNIVQANRWEWVGFLDSDGTAPKIYHGPLTTRPAQPSYNTQTTGVGAAGNDSGKNMQLGRYVITGTQTFNGRIAFIGVANRRMSDAELLTHWPKPRPVPGAGWVLFTWPGLHGTLSCVDLSGNKVNGTVDGTPTLAGEAGVGWPVVRLAVEG